MTRFKAQGRRYHSHLGSSYMGAGRTEDSFTFRARPSFAKIKQIYGEHLEALHPQYPNIKTQKIDQSVKHEVIRKVKIEHRKTLRRQIILATIITASFIILGLHLFKISNFSDFLLGNN